MLYTGSLNGFYLLLKKRIESLSVAILYCRSDVYYITVSYIAYHIVYYKTIVQFWPDKLFMN